MKPFIMSSAIACLVVATSLVGADVPSHPDKDCSTLVDPSKTPEGRDFTVTSDTDALRSIHPLTSSKLFAAMTYRLALAIALSVSAFQFYQNAPLFHRLRSGHRLF